MNILPETLGVGQGVVHTVRPYFELFREDGFAPALSLGLLVAAAIFGAFFLLRYVLLVRWVLWRQTRSVSQTRGYEGFAENFEAVDTSLSRSRLLRHAWKEFKETLILRNPSRIDDKIIYNTTRPHDYFNTHETRLQFRFYRALPNVFVGVGLLLTFFGLVSALFFATQGIAEGTDFNQTQNALRDLLHAASFKFYTSVAGLAASIALSLLVRWGIGVIEGGFDSLSQALEAQLVLKTPEAIAYEDSRELKQQTEYLKMFTTEVAVSVGRYVEEALNKTLPVHLSNAMEPVTKRLGEVTGNLNKMNEEALAKMADGFGERLQGATNDQFKGLADVLQNLRGSLDGISDRMNTSGDALADRIRQSSDEMHSAVTSMTNAIAEIATRVEGGAARSTEAMDRQLETTREAMAALAEQMRTSIETTATRLVQGSEDAAKRFSSEIDVAAHRLRDRTAEALSDVMGEFRGSVQQMADGLDRATSGLREVERSLLAHRSAMEAASSVAREVENAMTGAAKAIREGSAPLTTAAQGIADSSRRIGDALDRAVTTIQGSEARTRELTEHLGTTLDRVSRTWVEYEKRFADVDKSLEEALAKIVGQVQINMDLLHKYVTEFDDKLGQTVGLLNGGIDELGEFSQAMSESVSGLKATIDRAVARA
jgi:methyl-accepting chemotaxis protein